MQENRQAFRRVGGRAWRLCFPTPFNSTEEELR